MSIAVTCPSGHLLKIADSMAGKAGRCPFCREIVLVPAIGPAAEQKKAAPTTRSRSKRGGKKPAATPISALPLANVPDPAAADTVLMPISLADVPPSDALDVATTATAAEPDSPIAAAAGAMGGELDQMAQTLPLPTAELLPKLSASAPDPAHDAGLDFAHKARIVGSWKVLGDVVPAYVPEPGVNRGASAAASVSAQAAPVPSASAVSVPPTPSPSNARTGPPPLPQVRPSVAPTDALPVHRESVASTAAAARKKPWLFHPIAAGAAWPLHATVYRIALGLVFVSLFSMWPALRYWNLGVAPGWARVVLLVALLQLAYAAWLASVPDWASLWASMIVLAIVATIYGSAAAMTLATPMEHEPPLGLQAVRHAAPIWCGVVMTLTLGAAYLCGHAAQRIRRVAVKR